MQPCRIVEQGGITRKGTTLQVPAPLLARFLGKIVLDVMPAALASVIGGFLFTQYQFGHGVPHPALEQVQPASAEMMALVRDEHAVIIDYLKAQTAAEKSRLAAADIDAARPAPDAKVAPDVPIRHVAAVVVAAKPAALRSRVPAAAAAVPRAPLVIAQAGPNAELATVPADGAASDDRLARDPDSLLAKTLDLKDHVVAATRHVVSAIGDVFSSVGERIGGPQAGPRQFNS
jgi:hypothetical protein